MKKRILALALCLVMAVSLLPITAAANDDYYVCITGSGFGKGVDGAYILKDDFWAVKVDGSFIIGDNTGFKGCTEGLYQDSELTVRMTDDPADGGTYYLNYRLDCGSEEMSGKMDTYVNNSDCDLKIPGYTASCVGSGAVGVYFDIIFQVTKIHEHRWHYEKTADNSLTVICENSGCPIGKVGVTIDAHSVTLPDSPFNAQLKLEGDAKEVFSYGDIEYKYEDPGTGWEEVDPDTFTPKAGRYQAGILIYGLPGNGGVAARAVGNEDGFGQGEASVYLFVKYNAVDPAVTAQTGDNRPIELMMISAAVFSALAAAAFILDSKRRNASL